MLPHLPPLYILRHGETEWNAEGRLQGHLDSPLTPRGLAQAKAQHAILAAQDLSGFQAFASPQLRALTTASIALTGLLPQVETDTRLREIGVGAWAGRARQEIMIDRPLDESDESVFDLYERAPGGEGFTALAERCSAFLSALSTPAVLVTHGITSRMLRLLALDMDISEMAALPGGQGVVFRIFEGEQVLLTKGA